jgi:GAF domain-containing protein
MFRRTPKVILPTPEQRLAASVTLEEVIEVLRSSARLLADADGITIVEREGDEVRYVTEDAIAPLWQGQRFPIRQCVTGIALTSGAPVLIPDIRADPRVPLNLYLGTFVRSMAVMPIGTGDVRFALGMYWRDARPLPVDAIDRIAALAVQAAEAIDRIGRSAARDVA